MLRLILYFIVASYILILHYKLNAYTHTLATILNGEAIQDIEGTWAAKCKEIITVEHNGKPRQEYSVSEVQRIWARQDWE